MAPQPEYDKEPKAPDKSITNNSCEDSKIPHNAVNDQQTLPDSKAASSAASAETEEKDKHVEALDDGQLRALLDEAITYKCPKDREGKSNLFKELLEEVEQDEQACEAAARVWGAGGRRGRGARRRALPHSNSLQDLVAALAAEPVRRRVQPAPPVSARTLHGGSLPSGVDTSFLSEEPRAPRGVQYVATVRCENPSPLAERRVSASDCPENELTNRRSKLSAFPMTYTARATLEIGSGSVGSGRAVTTTTASNQVDSGIPFSCITSPEVVSSCSTTSSAPQSAVAVDAKPRAVSTSSFNGLPLSRPGHYGATGTTSTDEFKKSLDENGNSVQGFTSPLSGSAHKKPRRKKSSKNEVVIKSHQIDGYKGDKDLNEVLRFIEAPAERRGKLPARAKHDDDKKKRRKDKPARAASLEELSRCEPHALRHRRAPPPPAAPRRSWGDDAAYYPPPSSPPSPPPAPAKKKPSRKPDAAPDPPADTTLELLDFQTVTKKKKPRKRFDDGGGEGGGARAPPASPPRRKSAPPSDKSNDSNDDMDSVHSLPADPRRPASYADIARQRHNIPDLIESCNFYGEECAPAPAYDAHSYPALPRAPGKQPDVVAARPAVELRHPPAADLQGVTFGFDVNETLLRGGRRRCDLLLHLPPRYRPPPPPPPALQHTTAALADYVGCAWEDIMKLGSTKVRYYAE
ncbi:uncharacterized protein LOC105386908 [Plutella xylostella]|uniref:uncharacterized protein LOC105386908 n=1 Tax=Plutella xylostella TaxID=51655 RepID=UPI0020328978|nr:uncharacterized protein LOC105386908 [Plutella xylostella]